MTEPLTRTKYLNDIATALPVVLQESGPDGNISYAYGLSRISESSPEFDFFYQYDGLGSVVGLTDPRGRLRTRYAYDAWGQTAPSDEGDRTRARDKFRFTGEALDPATQLYYLRARFYDPSVGRFLRVDPIRHFPQYPLAANKYVYALSNPIRYADHSGFGLFDWLGAGIDLILGYRKGQQALTDYNAQLICAEQTASGCTLNDTVVNNTGQMQVQALNLIGAGGAAAGGAAYSGTNIFSSGPAAQWFDYTKLLVGLKQATQDLLALPGKIIQLLTPTANAASPSTQISVCGPTQCQNAAK